MKSLLIVVLLLVTLCSSKNDRDTKKDNELPTIQNEMNDSSAPMKQPLCDPSTTNDTQLNVSINDRLNGAFSNSSQEQIANCHYSLAARKVRHPSMSHELVFNGHPNDTSAINERHLLTYAEFPSYVNGAVPLGVYSRGRSDKRRPVTGWICDLKVVMDYSATSHAVKTRTLKSNFISDMLRIIDSYFRKSDIDGDHKSDNIGFHLASYEMHFDPVIKGQPPTSWNPNSFFKEMNRYNFSKYCAGLLYTMRPIDNDTKIEKWSPQMFRSNPVSLEQGICSTLGPKYPSKKEGDYGRYITNVLPVNMKFYEKGQVNNRSILVQTFHQLGHLFGAKDDDKHQDSTCTPRNSDDWYAMHYPVPPGTTLKRNLKLSRCSLKEIRNFLTLNKRPQCLKPCFQPDRCVQDFAQVPTTYLSNKMSVSSHLTKSPKAFTRRKSRKKSDVKASGATLRLVATKSRSSPLLGKSSDSPAVTTLPPNLQRNPEFILRDYSTALNDGAQLSAAPATAVPTNVTTITTALTSATSKTLSPPPPPPLDNPALSTSEPSNEDDDYGAGSAVISTPPTTLAMGAFIAWSLVQFWTLAVV